MTVIDFTRSRWGHAFHDGTFAPVERRQAWWRRLLRRDDMIRHYTVLVHCQRQPMRGDRIFYEGDGGIVFATIIDREWLGNVCDMYKLTIEITPADRPKQRGMDLHE